MDKTFWHDIIKNDYAVPDGHTVAGLTSELLGFLGETDSALRDEISYMILAHWITRDKLYSPAELRSMIVTLTANLETGIGEQGTDSVLLRSFSALSLSLIVYHDMEADFLSDDEVRDLLNKTLVYLAAEQDVRGYVEGLGWVHAVAHTADLLKFLARHPRTDAGDHTRILTAITDKLSAPIKHVYIHDEDERLVLVVREIIKRGSLNFIAWQGWLASFREWKDRHSDVPGFVVTVHAGYSNLKNFLRSLYFMVDSIADDSVDAKLMLDDIKAKVRYYSMSIEYTESS